MTTVTLRKQLYKQIETLPDDVVEQIADFTLFVMARRKIAPEYVDWSDEADEAQSEGDAEWDRLLETPQSQSLLQQMAKAAKTEIYNYEHIGQD